MVILIKLIKSFIYMISLTVFHEFLNIRSISDNDKTRFFLKCRFDRWKKKNIHINFDGSYNFDLMLKACYRYRAWSLITAVLRKTLSRLTSTCLTNVFVVRWYTIIPLTFYCMRLSYDFFHRILYHMLWCCIVLFDTIW